MSKADQNQTETELVDTVSTPDLEDQGSFSVNRRGFMRIGAGTAVAAGTATHPAFSPVGRARAALPLVPIGAAVGGAALGYLVNEGVDYIMGDDRDYSNYTGADALRTQIYTGTVNIASSVERVVTSLQNNVEYADNILLPKGKAAAVEAMNGGYGSSEQNDMMAEAIDEAAAAMQENIYTDWNEQVKQLAHMDLQLHAHSDASIGDVLNLDGDGFGIIDRYNTEPTMDDCLREESIELFDGRTLQVKYANRRTSSGHESKEWGIGRDPVVTASDPESTEVIDVLDPSMYDDLLTDLQNARDRVNANLATFISDLNEAYEPGEIPMDDVVDPMTAYLEMSTDYEETGHYGYAAASAAVLGIPSSVGRNIWIHLEESDVEVQADLYTKHEPEGGYETGVTYNPDAWAEPVYISYHGVFEDPETGEVSEETDFVQIEQEFQITEMTDKDGNEVDSTGLESKNVQTADIEALQEELEQLRELQLEMQEEAQEPEGGSGFDWSSFEVAGLAGEVVAGIGALVVSGLVAVGLIKN